MTETRKYYEAYEDRYRQVHALNLQWASDTPSPIVHQALTHHQIPKTAPILELGCGEGRDAIFLLKLGYNVTATDIAPEAIRHCQMLAPDFSGHFRPLDCVTEALEEKFAFIYAVAVLHMLTEDCDRAGFYRFLREHLTEQGVGLICTMGDGTISRRSDPATAFSLQERVHDQSGKILQLAGTSCRMVTFPEFSREIQENGLTLLAQGLTAAEPDFPVMMYATVKRS